jgi:hypothetical protein
MRLAAGYASGRLQGTNDITDFDQRPDALVSGIKRS